MISERRCLIVTGGARGLGKQIVVDAASAGMIVGLAYHRSEIAARNIAEQFPENVILLAVDIRDPQQIERGVQEFVSITGRVDSLVNNAGISISKRLEDTSYEQVLDVLAVNVLGTISASRAVLPFMLDQGSGSIVNISSVAASRPSTGQTAYSASKGAVESFTLALAVECGGKNIRVNCLALGPIESRMLHGTLERPALEALTRKLPLRRIGSPKHVSDAVLYLVGDQSSFTTGAILRVDGGYSLA